MFCSDFCHYLIFAVQYLNILLNTRGNAKIQRGIFIKYMQRYGGFEKQIL